MVKQFVSEHVKYQQQKYRKALWQKHTIGTENIEKY